MGVGSRIKEWPQGPAETKGRLLRCACSNEGVGAVSDRAQGTRKLRFPEEGPVLSEGETGERKTCCCTFQCIVRGVGWHCACPGDSEVKPDIALVLNTAWCNWSYTEGPGKSADLSRLQQSPV